MPLKVVTPYSSETAGPVVYQPTPPVIYAPLHEGQMRAQLSTARIVAMIAGSGGGKTAYGPMWCLAQQQVGPPPRHGLVVAPYRILVRTTQPAFVHLFRDVLGLGEWESKSDRIFKMYDGSYVYFAPSDTPESLEGAHVHWGWCDEAGQRRFPRAAYETMERRVRFYQGRVLISTTPYVIGWLKELVYDPWADGRRKDIEVINFPSDTNPAFPAEEMERARATLPAWQFKMFYQGLWDRPAGLIYAELLDGDCWVDALPEGADEWEHYAGVDFGFNHPTAVSYGVLSPDDVLYIHDEYYERGRTDAENGIYALYDKAAPIQAWGDSSSPEAIKEWGNQGWIIRGSERHSPKDRILEVIQRAKSGRLKLVRGRTGEHQHEMEGYAWQEARPDDPVKEKDDLCDSLGYLVWGLRSKGTWSGMI